jgi:hypothetical protein
MQLVRIEQDGAYFGLVGGSPKPRKGELQQLTVLPLELDARDARFVTELVSGIAPHTLQISMLSDVSMTDACEIQIGILTQLSAAAAA